MVFLLSDGRTTRTRRSALRAPSPERALSTTLVWLSPEKDDFAVARRHSLQCVSIASERLDIAVVSRGAPEVSRAAPEVHRVAPEVSRVAPEVSRVAPEVFRVAPEVSRVAPEVSRVVPEVHRVAPEVGNVDARRRAGPGACARPRLPRSRHGAIAGPLARSAQRWGRSDGYARSKRRGAHEPRRLQASRRVNAVDRRAGFAWGCALNASAGAEPRRVRTLHRARLHKATPLAPGNSEDEMPGFALGRAKLKGDTRKHRLGHAAARG
jgi:hypothetical protein